MKIETTKESFNRGNVLRDALIITGIIKNDNPDIVTALISYIDVLHENIKSRKKRVKEVSNELTQLKESIDSLKGNDVLSEITEEMKGINNNLIDGIKLVFNMADNKTYCMIYDKLSLVQDGNKTQCKETENLLIEYKRNIDEVNAT